MQTIDSILYECCRGLEPGHHFNHAILRTEPSPIEFIRQLTRQINNRSFLVER